PQPTMASLIGTVSYSRGCCGDRRATSPGAVLIVAKRLYPRTAIRRLLPTRAEPAAPDGHRQRSVLPMLTTGGVRVIRQQKRRNFIMHLRVHVRRTHGLEV